MLEIENLCANCDETPILKGVNLKVNPGEIHVIMGPNGAGKSTLAKVLAGHPSYEVISGEILLEGAGLLDMEPEERVHAGLFMSFQYPPEIPGVSNEEFLRQAYNACAKAKGKEVLGVQAFEKLLGEKMKQMGMGTGYSGRNINEGFSGGEKKRNEILQLLILSPKLAILDETDSGLDIDAMRVVAAGINHHMNKGKSLILITHYQRLLDYIKPHFVHVMKSGRIVKTGGPELALELEATGYDGPEEALW